MRNQNLIEKLDFEIIQTIEEIKKEVSKIEATLDKLGGLEN